jgi:hypothetical protein
MNWKGRRKNIDHAIQKLEALDIRFQEHEKRLDIVDGRVSDIVAIVPSVLESSPKILKADSNVSIDRVNHNNLGSLPGTQVKIFASTKSALLQDQINDFLKMNPGLSIVDVTMVAGPNGIYCSIFYRTGLDLESINS